MQMKLGLGRKRLWRDFDRTKCAANRPMTSTVDRARTESGPGGNGNFRPSPRSRPGRGRARHERPPWADYATAGPRAHGRITDGPRTVSPGYAK